VFVIAYVTYFALFHLFHETILDLGVTFTLSVILLFYFIDLGVMFNLSVILLFYFIDLGVMFTLSVILLFYFIDLGALKIRGTYRKARRLQIQIFLPGTDPVKHLPLQACMLNISAAAGMGGQHACAPAALALFRS
jgi:hypothetical protein